MDLAAPMIIRGGCFFRQLLPYSEHVDGEYLEYFLDNSSVPRYKLAQYLNKEKRRQGRVRFKAIFRESGKVV